MVIFRFLLKNTELVELQMHCIYVYIYTLNCVHINYMMIVINNIIFVS